MQVVLAKAGALSTGGALADGALADGRRADGGFAGRRRAGVSLSRRPLSLDCVLDPERARRTCGIVRTSASKEE